MKYYLNRYGYFRILRCGQGKISHLCRNVLTCRRCVWAELKQAETVGLEDISHERGIENGLYAVVANVRYVGLSPKTSKD